jgi:hypothetical protein
MRPWHSSDTLHSVVAQQDMQQERPPPTRASCNNAIARDHLRTLKLVPNTGAHEHALLITARPGTRHVLVVAPSYVSMQLRRWVNVAPCSAASAAWVAGALATESASDADTCMQHYNKRVGTVREATSCADGRPIFVEVWCCVLRRKGIASSLRHCCCWQCKQRLLAARHPLPQ